MATNDVNLQVINSMTQDKMNSLKDSSGKIPSLANQIIMTDEEDVNLSQLKTKLLWTNPNPTASFSAKTVTFENNETFDYFLIISRYNTNIDSYVSHFGEIGKSIHITDVRAKSGSHFAMYERSATTTQTSVTFSDADEQYTDGSFVVSNTTLVPYKIIGLKKSPAMIYTGAELHDGNGISIENGVIGVEKSAILAELSNNYGIPAINTKFNLTLNQVLNVGNKLAFINNKIKIVGDVSFIKATAKVVVNTSGAGNLHMYINKNGTSFAVTPNTMVNGVNSISIPNVLINVQQGDELDFSLHSAVGGTVQGASYRTYLMVEVIK